MQSQFDETKDLLKKEREAAKKLSERDHIIQEGSVVDHEKIDKLTAENEELKVGLVTVNYFHFVSRGLSLQLAGYSKEPVS